MKLKVQGNNEAVIEKFCAQSCKTAKYAKSVVKKKDANDGKTVGGNNATTSGPTVDSASVSASIAGGGEARFGEN